MEKKNITKDMFKNDLINLIGASKESQEVKDKVVKSIRIRKGLLNGEFDAWCITENGSKVVIKSEDFYDDYSNYPTLAKRGIIAEETVLDMLDLHLPEIDAEMVDKYLYQQGMQLCVENRTANLKKYFILFHKEIEEWKKYVA